MKVDNNGIFGNLNAVVGDSNGIKGDFNGLFGNVMVFWAQQTKLLEILMELKETLTASLVMVIESKAI